MSSGNDPNAWLGLLKWSLSYQDGTTPSDFGTMSDEDRQWLERVVSEGVRDDVKAMTEIYSRLCDYLDVTASEMHRTPPSPAPPRSPQQHGEQGQAVVETTSEETPPPAGGLSLAVAPPSPPPPIAVLSTFLAPSAVSGVIGGGESGSGGSDERADNAGEGVGGEEGGVNSAGSGERMERVLNDLEELQDIVEQIDMAATFVKIGGFGRLIALVRPGYRAEKLRLRAASVIATLTKNNPPAQAEFSMSGGQEALLEAVLGPPTAGTGEGGDASQASPPSVSSTVSCPLQRAILHALSCSVMGVSSGEDALCKDARFPVFLSGALGHEHHQGDPGREEDQEESGKLRGKAAFVLKALVGAPGASVERVKALRPAIMGLLVGLEEAFALGGGEGGDGGLDTVARETYIEALVAAARSSGGARIVTELGSRVSMIMSRRRQALVEAGSNESGTRSEEDVESAEIELALWLEWERLCGPAQ